MQICLNLDSAWLQVTTSEPLDETIYSGLLWIVAKVNDWNWPLTVWVVRDHFFLGTLNIHGLDIGLEQLQHLWLHNAMKLNTKRCGDMEVLGLAFESLRTEDY